MISVCVVLFPHWVLERSVFVSVSILISWKGPGAVTIWKFQVWKESAAKARYSFCMDLFISCANGQLQVILAERLIMKQKTSHESRMCPGPHAVSSQQECGRLFWCHHHAATEVKWGSELFAIWSATKFSHEKLQGTVSDPSCGIFLSYSQFTMLHEGFAIKSNMLGKLNHELELLITHTLV